MQQLGELLTCSSHSDAREKGVTSGLREEVDIHYRVGATTGWWRGWGPRSGQCQRTVDRRRREQSRSAPPQPN
jgi:hypothetical protein